MAQHLLHVDARLAKERLQRLYGVLRKHGVVEVQQAEGEEAEGFGREPRLSLDQPRKHIRHVQQARQRERVAVAPTHNMKKVLAYGRKLRVCA